MGTSTASFDIDARTDRGRQRSNNQDSIGRADRWKNRDGQPIERSLRERYGRLYIVADGVGGNADGADASRMVVDEVMQAFYYDTRLPEEPVERLRAAIEFVTSVIHAEAHRRRNNMASTIVAALIHDDTLTIANVGDSPALLCRLGQTPKLLTKAHVRREADGGTSLAQAMGDQQVVPSIFSMPLEEGDAVVLCSDGLTDLVQPDEIAEIVSTRPAGDATRTLIALANRRGGHDNISAIVVRNAPPPKGVAPLSGQRMRMAVAALGVAGLLGVVLLALPLLNAAPILPQGSSQQSGTSLSTPLFGSGSHTTIPGGLPTSTLGALPTPTDTPVPSTATRRPSTARPTAQPSPISSTLVLSTGETIIPTGTPTPDDRTIMPDLIRKSLQEAEHILKTWGVQYITEVVPGSDDIPPGHVVATDPPAGAKIVPGTTIKIKVRQNPTPTPTNSPSSAKDDPPPPRDDPPTATPTPQMSGPVVPTAGSDGSGGSGGDSGGSGGTGP
jgi:serine/threonine protein phosphatase PrpC